MPRLPKRLFGPAQLGNAAADLYTVPAGGLAIVRHIHVSNPDTVAHTYTLSIGADAAGTRWFESFSIPAKGVGVVDSVRDHSMYLVLGAAEKLQGFADVASKLVVVISGDEYSAG